MRYWRSGACSAARASRRATTGGRWYVERFLALRRTAFRDTTAFFHRFADLTDDQARDTALGIWAAVNGPNLRSNIAPTRSRARLVLHKAADHSVRRVLLRKL